MELLATEREIHHPAKRKKEKFTRKLQDGLGKQKSGDRKAKPICHNWSKGNGYCRYAAACNFSHDDPQGGGKRKWKDNPTSLPVKAVKRAQKELMSMVVEAIAENLWQDPHRTHSSIFVEERKQNQWE